MLLGCIADDFTGAGDLANMLAREGMRTVQFSGVPASADVPECDAAVVALKTRSVASADAVAASLEALTWLEEQGCRQFFFKYCSTFDSTPAGNIGPVAEALLDALGERSAIVCPAFPATGRRLFMGHLFVGDRPLHESGMENHPLNPMTDSDIRRWLKRQTRGDVGFVPHPSVLAGTSAIGAVFEAETLAGRRLIVVDAVSEGDIRGIGRAAAGHRLVTGGSAVAMGLPANFPSHELLGNSASDFTPLPGKAAVLSGSCSPTSLAQVAQHLRGHEGLAVDTDALMSGRMTARAAVEFLLDSADEAPILYSSDEPAKVGAAQKMYGRDRLAAAIETFFSEVAAQLVARGTSRLAVGGGETSGAVVTALRLPYLLVGPEIDPGVPALAVDGRRPLRLALKSGNFGSVDFYDKALGVMGGR